MTYESSISLDRRKALGLLAGLPFAASTAHSEGAYPDKPLQLIVPYGTGTATDSLARRLASAMPALVGQNMQVENRGGGNGFIGAQFAARAAPDGYSFILATDHVMCYNPALFKTLPYSPTRDFTAVAGLTSHPHLLVVSPSVPARNVAELVALAKKSPGSLTFASTGVGTAAHLVGEVFKQDANIDITHVPYPGGAQLFPDLLSGRVSMAFYAYQLLKPYMDTGKLRALANATDRRADWLPELPTMPELGYPRTVMAAWLAIYAPKGTPADRVTRMSDAFRKALEMPDIGGQLPQIGIDIRYRSPADQASFTVAQLNHCQAVVALSGAKVE